MRYPYVKATTKAISAPASAEPRASPWLLAAVRLVSRPYLRLALGYRRIDVDRAGLLVDAFRDFQEGRTRLILAFRHPYGDEAQLMAWLFSRGVMAEARRLGAPLPDRAHAVFIHGYEVPRWSGPAVRWLLPRMGALPVHHSKVDRPGLERINAAIMDGRWPLALAPEGQVSYASRDVPRLEDGTVRLGFGAAAALRKAGRPERVVVVPISVFRHCDDAVLPSLGRLVRRLEGALGVDGAGRTGAGLKARLDAAAERLVALAEGLYGLKPSETGPGLDARLAAVTLAAVEAAERILDLGSYRTGVIERVYRVRQAGWDRIYPDTDPGSLHPAGRALADRRAGEAWYAMRHMELADLAFYLSPDRLDPAAPLDSVVEYAQNLWDLANRLMGGVISGRVNVRPIRARIAIGPALDLSGRMAAYEADPRTAVRQAGTDLKDLFLLDAQGAHT